MRAADELRAAANLIRERAQAADGANWPGRPWAIEACAQPQGDGCACIVYQGEYQPLEQPQVPAIDYICDAETPERATHIAALHPGVALALADWLDETADQIEHAHKAWAESDYVTDLYGGADAHTETQFSAVLAVARAYLGTDEDGDG